MHNLWKFFNPVSDWFAMSMTKFFRFIADTFFAKRYGHRAVVLETVAGVPGMVAGMWIHLRSLRKMQTGYGPKIRELLAEAENERMHLMFFVEITVIFLHVIMHCKSSSEKPVK